VLQNPATLHLDSEQIGGLGSFYLAGAVVGALVCGHLTDRHGRAKLFFATLAIYLAGTLATAFTWDFSSMAACRVITGFGIGGEYAAINSAIDELIPARVRGQVNLTINGSYWLGTALGSLATLVLLDPKFFRSTSAGGQAFSSARCSASPCSSRGDTCRRVRAGSRFTGSMTRRCASSPVSKRALPGATRWRWLQPTMC
jgi:MFS family permease